MAVEGTESARTGGIKHADHAMRDAVRADGGDGACTTGLPQKAAPAPRGVVEDPWKGLPTSPMPVEVSMAWGWMPRWKGADEAVYLSTHDGSWWSQERLPFRVRLRASEDSPTVEGWRPGMGMSLDAARTARLLGERARPLIRGEFHQTSDGFYLADVEDLRRLVLNLRRHVTSVQTREQYEAAVLLGRAIFRTNADYVDMLDRMGKPVDAERRAAAEFADAWDRAGHRDGAAPGGACGIG